MDLAEERRAVAAIITAALLAGSAPIWHHQHDHLPHAHQEMQYFASLSTAEPGASGVAPSGWFAR